MAHIEINNAKDCCGCGVCVSVCPTDCIEMISNAEGFLYPQVDVTRCNRCGICVEGCPWQNQPDIYKRINPPYVYAAWHLNSNVRLQSSSGGVFTAIAEEIISRKGIVVGAGYSEKMIVRHELVEDTDSLAKLRGSKYAQSEISPKLFSIIRSTLNKKRLVLFSGTPCQVAALRNYLHHDYENLVCCDLVCLGVPSPGWLKYYISTLNKVKQRITSLDFRYKSRGWKRFRVRKTWNGEKSKADKPYSDPFMASFLKKYSLRESCYDCQFTHTTRMGDITLADYWKVSTKYPEYDKEDKGTSLVLINSEKGRTWINHCQDRLFMGKGDLAHAIYGNPMLTRSAARPPERETFYFDLAELTLHELRKKYQLHPRKFHQRAVGFIQRRLSSRSSL
jgi:coenzyme F420-reducing hydrogenase beta subunit